MKSSFEIWEMLAGIAIFILGMNFIEKALKSLSGRQFKIFLKKYTSSKIGSIFGGAIVTGILQSSSIVNLMVLAFVGARIININSALAVMMGANLGTTFDTWVIASLGFKLNIEDFAMPIVGIGGIMMTLFKQETKGYNWSMFSLGFGFLFIGLSYMKASILTTVESFDLSSLNNYSVFFYVIAGIIITSLIQSSSTTVAIVLSALSANVINLYVATAIVLGAELGTTVKLLIASMGGTAIKKKVATSNFLFNAISVIAIFFFLKPINHLIVELIGITDPLIALASFQTFINLVSIIVFSPFLNSTSTFLDRYFKNGDGITVYINKTTAVDGELSILTLEKEVLRFVHHVIYYCQNIFYDVEYTATESESQKFQKKTITEQYEYLKQLHGYIHNYCASVQSISLTNDESDRLGALVSGARNCMYAAKNIKDAIPDIKQLKNSSTKAKYEIYKKSKKLTLDYCEKIIDTINSAKPMHFEKLVELHKSIEGNYNVVLKNLYKEKELTPLPEIDISTIINFNHELYGFFKSITFSIKDVLLHENERSYFDDLPAFKM